MSIFNNPLKRVNVPVLAVEPKSVESRTKILVSAGNDQLAAEFIAKKADEQQVLRDAGIKQEIEVRTRALVGTVAEVTLTGTDAPPSHPPRTAAVPVPMPVFTDMTIDQLRAHATEHGFEIAPDLRLKADLATAVAAAHAAKYPQL